MAPRGNMSTLLQQPLKNNAAPLVFKLRDSVRRLADIRSATPKTRMPSAIKQPFRVALRICSIIATIAWLHGCDNGVCITPDQIYTQSATFMIDAYPKQYSANEIKSSPWLGLGWTKTDFDHISGEEINVRTSGLADMCGLTAEDLKTAGSVPASELKYNTAVIDFTKTTGTPNISGASYTGHYVSGTTKVLPDDIVSFSLDDVRIAVDCDNPASNINILDIDLCKNGATIDIRGQQIPVEAYNGKQASVSYNTDPSRVGNFLFYDGIPQGWAVGGQNGYYDLIIPQVQDVSAADCASLTLAKNKVPAATINRACGRLCPDADYQNIGSASKDSGCATSTKITQSGSLSPQTTSAQHAYMTRSWAIVVDEATNTELERLLDAGTGRTELNNVYEVKNKGTIYFGYETIPGTSKGGFRIKITRDCKKRALKALYMYIGNQPPTKRPGPGGGANSMKIVDLKNLDPATQGTDKDINTIATHAYQIEKGLPEGSIYLGFDTTGDITDNNTGKINVTLSKPRHFAGTISKGVTGVRDAILDITDGKIDPNTGKRVGGAAGDMYKGIMQNPYFKNIIYAVLMIYITLTGMFYLTGIAPLTKESAVIGAIKIAVVASILSPRTADIYRDLLQGLFINGLDFIINATTSFDDKFTTQTDFSFMDSSLGRFTVPETGIQLLALFLSGPLGWFVLLCIIVAVICYGFVVIKAVVLYLMTLVLIVFLLALLPLFFITLLFKFTSKIFHAWIKVLVTNTIKPVLVFITLAIFNQLMMAALYNIFNFSVCDDCALSFRIIPDVAAFCLINGPIPVGYDPMLSFERKAERASAFADSTFFMLPIDISHVGIMLFIAFSAMVMAEKSTVIASSITGTFAGSINFGAVDGMFQKALGLVGMDRESIERRSRAYHKEAASKRAALTDKEKDAVQRGTGRGLKDGKSPQNQGASTTLQKTNDLQRSDKEQLDPRKRPLPPLPTKGGAKNLTGGASDGKSLYDEEIYDTIDESKMIDTGPNSGKELTARETTPTIPDSAISISKIAPETPETGAKTAPETDGTKTRETGVKVAPEGDNENAKPEVQVRQGVESRPSAEENKTEPDSLDQKKPDNEDL